MKENRFDAETLWILIRGIVAILAVLFSFFFFTSGQTNLAMISGGIFIVSFLSIMK